jgi:hypothetical protein
MAFLINHSSRCGNIVDHEGQLNDITRHDTSIRIAHDGLVGYSLRSLGKKECADEKMKG